MYNDDDDDDDDEPMEPHLRFLSRVHTISVEDFLYFIREETEYANQMKIAAIIRYFRDNSIKHLDSLDWTLLNSTNLDNAVRQTLLRLGTPKVISILNSRK